MGTQVGRIAEVIDSFDVSRRGDLWSGSGLAATYAGGGDAENLFAMCEAAGTHLRAVAQGAAFAAKARQRAGNPTENMHETCITHLPSIRGARIEEPTAMPWGHTS